MTVFVIHTALTDYQIVARDISHARLTAQELFPEDEILRVYRLMEWN